MTRSAEITVELFLIAFCQDLIRWAKSENQRKKENWMFTKIWCLMLPIPLTFTKWNYLKD